MANDTRSTCKNKEDENSNSKGRHNSGKVLTSSSSETPDTMNLRRSARETSSSKKNMTPSPSSTRKSERIEKRISTITPIVQRKSDRVEKPTAPVPLRRSERGKKPFSSSSASSKKFEKGSSSSEIKSKKEKSVKQLTMETKEVSNNYEEEDRGPVRVIKKNMDARTFRTLFKAEKVKVKDHDKELNRNNSNHKNDSSKKVNGNVEFSERRQGELREKEFASSCDVTLEGPIVSVNSSAGEKSNVQEANSPEVGESTDFTRSDKMEVIADADHEKLDCFSKENFPSLEVADSAVGEGTLNGITGSEKHHNVMPLKRKRNEVDVHSDASAMIANKDMCVSHAEVIASSPKECAETCGTCFKRQRVSHDSTRQELCTCLLKANEKLDEGLSDASTAEDRGELEASIITEPAAEFENNIQQNGALLDVPTDGYQDTCTVCKLGGELLCCDGKGCKRSYHLSCLDPPLKDVPFGAWHCILCVRKKIEAGLYSLSKGVESIWDAREVEVLDSEGLRKQKQYFVKYKCLAHVHNRWVPESQVLCEVPLLVEKFNQKNQVARWKQEWTLPHRLLQRRSLFSPKQYDEYFRERAPGGLDCHYEWLVKWRGLDYENATWELENASFINSPKGQRLIRDYENRREKAKSFSSSLSTVEKKTRQGFPVRLSQLSAGGSSGSDNTLEFVNNLREYWHKGQNAVVFDDQERISKVILFIMSLLLDVCRPFLIISTSDLLHLWEDEFLRLAPSVDVVVYSGNNEMRKSVRTLEFYEEGGCIMFQALVTSPEFLTEDLNVFESIGWEAIIVDECQLSNIFSHFEQIKMLVTDMRLLLVSGQLKDSIAEYVNMLDLLDSQPHSDLPSSEGIIGSNYDISCLKEKLSKYVAYGRKLESSRFVEYWVPVEISNVQLEQYCATLLKNSFSLCSPLKKDHVGALHDILSSTRKCCDHPYLVDQSLQSLLIKDLKESEYLDVGIKASGKLQLLDTMLSEMKNRALRVIILFQSIGGSGKDSISMGDILDDFVRQRFGPDSYERVDGNILPSKKQAALNNFNKDRGRFVFLLETRACVPSIKLSSVDTVIIFHSEWSDLRALQKITLDSQPEQIKVFRLYSSFTVEEKALILAKQDKNPDAYFQNVSRGTSHELLMWGASYLFNRLDKFHGNDSPASSSSDFEQSILKDVAKEFLTILTQTGEDNDSSEFNKIVKVKQNRGTYSTKFLLFGESKIEVTDEGIPHLFWMKLLEQKSPCWKYSSVSSQRTRKRVQYFNDLQKNPDVAKEEIVKKHRKVANDAVDPSSLKPGLEEGKRVAREKEGTSRISAHGERISLKHASSLPSVGNNIPGSPRELCYPQKMLHLLLKPEITKLCDVLQLREDVKDVVDKFLEYVMINHRLSREPATVMQAFQISLCWIAASLLKQKVDHKGSLALAKQHLDFSCSKGEVDFIYSKLQCLKKVFLCQMEKLKMAYCPKVSEMSTESFSKNNLHASSAQPETSNLQKVKVEVEDWSMDQEGSIEQDLFMVAQKDFSKSIRGIQKKCQKLRAKLLQKHQKDKEDIEQKYEEEKAELEKKKRVEELVIIRQNQENVSMQTDRLKILDNEYAKQFEELKHKRDIQLEKLKKVQRDEMKKLCERETSWVAGVKSWLKDELQHKPLSNESGPSVQCMQTSKELNSHDSLESTVPVSSNLSEGLNPNNLVPITPVGGVELSGVHETVPDTAVACSHPIETLALAVRSSDELNTIASERTPVAGSKEHPEAGNLSKNKDNMVSTNPCSKEQIPDGAVLSMPDKQIHVGVSETFKSSFPENGLTEVHLYEEQNHDGTRLDSEGDFLMRVSETVHSSKSFENVASANGPLCDKVPDGATTRIPDGEVLLRVPETACSTGGLDDVTTVNTHLSEEQIPNGLTLNVPEVEVPAGVPENIIFSDGLENVVSDTIASSGEENPCGATLCMPDTEVPLGAHETSRSEVEGSNTNGGNDGPDEISSDNGTGVNQDDRVDYNVNLHELSHVNSPSVQTSSTVAQDGSILPNQALCSEASTSSGAQIEAASASDMQNPSDKQVEASISHLPNDVVPDRSNHGAAPVTEPVAQRQLPSVDVLSGRNSSDLPPVSGLGSRPITEHCITNQVAEGPIMMIENHVEPSNRAISQPNASFGPNYPIVTAVDGLGTSISDTSTASVTSVHINHTVQNAPSVVSRLPDPLQNELDRLCKEIEKSSKIHEETKLQLKSDCDREIMQIRRKYEIKLQETEAEFRIKKEELDTNYSKVLMSKILAEAFKSKFLDLKAPAAAMLQELSSSYIQQIGQTSSHQTAQRPPTMSGPSSGPLTSTLQATSTPAINLQTTSPAARPRTGVPPLQAVHHSAALLSSAPVRPPHISSMISPTGNHQLGSGIRAPAPHLQPFRPSMSVSSTGLQQMPGNPAATSPSLAQTPRPPAPPPTSHSGTYSRAHRSDTVGGVPSLPNSSLSALDLLMDLDNRSGANSIHPSSLPPPSDTSPRFGTPVQPESSLPGSMQASPGQITGATDIVCLSDDD